MEKTRPFFKVQTKANPAKQDKNQNENTRRDTTDHHLLIKMDVPPKGIQNQTEYTDDKGKLRKPSIKSIEMIKKTRFPKGS